MRHLPKKEVTLCDISAKTGMERKDKYLTMKPTVPKMPSLKAPPAPAPKPVFELEEIGFHHYHQGVLYDGLDINQHSVIDYDQGELEEELEDIYY